ncbi:hypothetical protein SAMN04488065_1784 [Haloplanus vescus]|uniref:DUF4352 domain-containing protein n=1 Tax=Haloplanus vescus TaxID=555874 RepID=A0A1H3YDS8_9EURY|nr:DUF4352 domain-containing protein [Haloplanus vescus]SEA09058.1 hypothetical protein SAMN04488065_1784 [Haloplanus vescus]
MRRRAFLASTGIAALAGCSTGDSSTDGTATPTSTATSTESGEPNFEIRGTRFPSTQTLNVATTFVIAIQNTGTGDGTFTSELETKVGDGEWGTAGEIEMDVPAGETAEWHSPEFTAQYLTTLYFRLADFDETWSIEITPRELDFGNYYAAPNGLYINLLGGSFESSYPTSDDSGNTTATSTTTATATPTTTPTSAPDGKTWAVISADVRNRLQEPLTTPPADSFELTIDGESQPQHQEVSDNPYESGELEGRTVIRGELVYAVPEGTTVDDIEVVWSQSLSKGDVKSIWTR